MQNWELKKKSWPYFQSVGKGQTNNFFRPNKLVIIVLADLTTCSVIKLFLIRCRQYKYESTHLQTNKQTKMIKENTK